MPKILWLVDLVVSIILMVQTKSKVSDGQQVNDALNTKEKVIIWFLCIFNPVLAGAILYYGWKKKLPIKAKQANRISIWAFLIEVVLGILIFIISPK